MAEKAKLNFLLMEKPGGWVARCLEHNFVTQADTLNDLYYEIQRTIVGHLAISLEQGHRPFEGMTRAPAEFWEMYSRSALRVEPTRAEIEFNVLLRAPLEAPEPELRIAVAGAG